MSSRSKINKNKIRLNISSNAEWIKKASHILACLIHRQIKISIKINSLAFTIKQHLRIVPLRNNTKTFILSKIQYSLNILTFILITIIPPKQNNNTS